MPGDRFDPWPGQSGKRPVLSQLLQSLELLLGSDPWSGSSLWCGVAKEGKKKKKAQTCRLSKFLAFSVILGFIDKNEKLSVN